MLKRIRVEDLKPGMFIIDVTQSWSRLLDLNKQMYIQNYELIRQLIESGFSEVFIETSKTKRIVDEIPKAEKEKTFDLQVNLNHALSVRSATQQAIRDIMQDIQNGKKVEINHAKEAVDGIEKSINNDPKILAGLVLMQQKNKYLFEHSVTSCVLMAVFAKAQGFDTQIQKEITMGTLLHDIGMINLPSKILYKPGSLNPEEQKEVQKHVNYGLSILSQAQEVPDIALNIVAEHHERFDGSGYPKGLKHDQISMYGQMASIVDVYDAATSDHGYKKGIPPTQAMAEILLKSDNHFEGSLVNSFIKSIGIYPFGSLVKLQCGLTGIVTEVDSDNLLAPTVRVIFDSNNGGLIKPYNLELKNYRNDSNYKIVSIEKKEKLFLQEKDIIKILAA